MSKKEKLKDILNMCAVFFKIGLFSFGGGYAMLSMIEREAVEKHKWLTKPELMDVFAVAESTPGAISVNIATFIGTQRGGILGGVLTTLALILPSLIIISAISLVIDLIYANPWVQYIFRGIRVGVVVLIARISIKFFKDIEKTWLPLLLFATALALGIFTSVSVIYVVLGSVALSIAYAAGIRISANRKFGKIITYAHAYERDSVENTNSVPNCSYIGDNRGESVREGDEQDTKRVFNDETEEEVKQ
jgi:chromate transporter